MYFIKFTLDCCSSLVMALFEQSVNAKRKLIGDVHHVEYTIIPHFS